MDPNLTTDPASKQQGAAPLMDVFIRGALIAGLFLLCYMVISPFLSLLIWSIILAVTLYPLHQRIAKLVKGKQGIASVLLIVIGILLIVTPTGLLLNSFADSIRDLIGSVQQGSLKIPPPPPGVENWPVIGRTVSDLWTQAYSDLPGLVHSMQPKIGELAEKALSIVAGIGTGLLVFLISFMASGVIMAYGESSERTIRSLFERIADKPRGDKLVDLSAATIRSVALGVLGVAFIQAIFVGLAMLIAGIPAAGVWAMIVLVIGIAQVPALLVTLPVIIYIWSSGDYSTSAAIFDSIILLVAGMSDNVLKPIMLGRGVDVPMPIILFGALGGMATGGIVGLFVGATVLAIGYTVFKSWLASGSAAETPPVQPEI
jgi:predicted PurR-regulated permease PerM